MNPVGHSGVSGFNHSTEPQKAQAQNLLNTNKTPVQKKGRITLCSGIDPMEITLFALQGAVAGAVLGMYALAYKPSYGFFPALLSVKQNLYLGGENTAGILCMSIGALAGLTVGVAKEIFKKYHTPKPNPAASSTYTKSDVNSSAEPQKLQDDDQLDSNENQAQLKDRITSNPVADSGMKGIILGFGSGFLIGQYGVTYKPTWGFFPLLLSHDHPDFGPYTARLTAPLFGGLIGGVAGLALGVAKEIFKKYHTPKAKQAV